MSTTQAWLHLVFLIAMIAIEVGGLVGIILLWYVRGRDPATGLVAEYDPEPPDDLPPGAAGTLIDEHVDRSDVVATLLGLGRHGAITIDPIDIKSDERSGRTFELTVIDPAKVGSRLERDLLDVLFSPNQPEHGMTVDLASVRPRFEAQTDILRAALYEELVVRKYFRISPEFTRRRWKQLSIAGLVSSVILGTLLAIQVDSWALLPTSAGIATFLTLLKVSRAMPQKTFHGAEAAAHWRAFKRYLESIEKRIDLSGAQDQFDRYLAYAVAFRIDKEYIQAFARVGTTTPGWYGRGGVDGEDVFETIRMGQVIGHFGMGDVHGMDVPSIGMPTSGIPDFDLQGAADAVGGGLQGASDGFGGLLDTAGGVFDSFDFDL